eukprot:TRINITY_DN664_c0_g1_i3.p1 TRINITY_DN664_c0_g1~~TRINITY_DN664_c0_g1_i3.p1  ORF type:complete len:105 (-),score=12.61 TRINITY_DN664_c0_g1_i3:610-924(-)
MSMTPERLHHRHGYYSPQHDGRKIDASPGSPVTMKSHTFDVNVRRIRKQLPSPVDTHRWDGSPSLLSISPTLRRSSPSPPMPRIERRKSTTVCIKTHTPTHVKD